MAGQHERTWTRWTPNWARAISSRSRSERLAQIKVSFRLTLYRCVVVMDELGQLQRRVRCNGENLDDLSDSKLNE